jgi:hypothetical protein
MWFVLGSSTAYWMPHRGFWGNRMQKCEGMGRVCSDVTEFRKLLSCLHVTGEHLSGTT